MAIEKEQNIFRRNQRNRTIGIITATTAMALACGIGTIVHYWDELHGVAKIRAATYQVANEKNSPVLTKIVNRNESSDLRRTHTPQEIADLEKVAETINNNCPVQGDTQQFTPHRDFFFNSPEAARNCLNTLRKIQLPGE